MMNHLTTIILVLAFSFWLKNYQLSKPKHLSQKEKANTRMIVVKWFIMLFNNFDTDLIDRHVDIYE
jgi:hypothetical protein